MPQAPMFYKDAFGQWRITNPSMAGRTFQGPNHAYMVYGSDGIAYPVGEQRGNNGEAGRQWDRPGDPVAAQAYDRLMQRAGQGSVLARGFGGTSQGQWNANAFTAQDAAAVGAPAGLIRAATATPVDNAAAYNTALNNPAASPAARAYLASHASLFNAHPISPPDPPPPPSGPTAEPPANQAPPVPDPFAVPSPASSAGTGPAPAPPLPAPPQPQVKIAPSVGPSQVPSPFSVAPPTIQPPKPSDAITTTRIMPRAPQAAPPTVAPQQKEATKFQFKQAGGVPSPFGTKNVSTSPFQTGKY